MSIWESPKEVEAMFKTLEIREVNGIEFPNNLITLKIAMRKSALFQRLLSGKEPFPIPPPTSYSYPWYELLENGYAFPYEVWKTTNNLFAPFPAVGIDQSIWKLIEEIAENDYIISYTYGIGKSKISDTKWHVYPIASNIEAPRTTHLWKIELVP